MGLSSSQSRLLALTQRNNDIKLDLTRLSMQKMSLANDMLKVSQRYQQALNTKSLKWTNNGGVDYTDISYSNLMRPCAANSWNLYMLTDMNGRVVVDESYRQFAEMVSPDGAPGGDWESNRNTILPQVLGLSQTAFTDADNYNQQFLEWSAKLDELDNNPINPRDSKYNFIQKSTKELFKKLGTYDGINFSNFDSTNIPKEKIDNVMDYIFETLKGYFPEDEDTFKQACEAAKGCSADQTVQQLAGILTGTLKNANSNLVHLADNGSDEEICWYNTQSDSYKTYLQDKGNWQTQHDEAEEKMNNYKTLRDEIYSPDVVKQIDFYDALFSSIAEKGWKNYPEVADSNYLDQMMQNGLFAITTVDCQRKSNASGTGFTYDNTYETDLPLNSPNIVQVSDDAVRDAALVQYEHDKQMINAKETKIDTRMKNKETEQEAVKQMIDSIKKVMDTNIENHFNIFG